MNNNGFEDIRQEINETIDPKKNKHDRMKLFGRKILFYMGISSNNIVEEETIDFKGRRYRVDLIGYPTGKNYPNSLSVAIECGDNKAEKIEAMRNMFSLVLILPYKEFDVLNTPEIKAIQKITKDLEQQTISNYYYLGELKKIENEFIKTDNGLRLQLQNESEKVTRLIEQEFKVRIDNIDSKIKLYENDLKYLKEFREWCTKFACLE